MSDHITHASDGTASLERDGGHLLGEEPAPSCRQALFEYMDREIGIFVTNSDLDAIEQIVLPPAVAHLKRHIAKLERERDYAKAWEQVWRKAYVAERARS